MELATNTVYTTPVDPRHDLDLWRWKREQALTNDRARRRRAGYVAGFRAARAGCRATHLPGTPAFARDKVYGVGYLAGYRAARS